MDQNSLLRQAKASSLDFPIRGMESVVATVSGYHGSERFNLIKMISRSGASYVGNMNKSITHLICWKYEGKKFELAKKLRKIIVNHQWIEDCIKKGKRVPEYPYTDQCGEEVGPLLFSPIADKPSNQFNSLNGSKEKIIDLESEDSAYYRLADSTLLKENQLPKHSEDRHRVKKKTRTSSSGQDQLSGRGYYFVPLFGSSRMEDELNLPDSEVQRKPKTRNSAPGEPSWRGRRLVKGKASRDTLDPVQECDQTQNFEENCDGIATTSSDRRRQENVLSSKNATIVLDATSSDRQRQENILSSKNATIVLDDIEEIEDVNDGLDNNNQDLSSNGSLSCIRNMEGCCSSVDGKVNSEHTAPPPKAAELSCVICWTDFSSTRGVLKCGHRFCFSCIESWSNQLRSARKDATCPLCKAKFEKITRVDDAVPSDQKVYTQTNPPNSLGTDVYVLRDETPAFPGNLLAASTCCQCFCQEPQELLERCHLCQIRCIHVYCLDPPLFPWTCNNCKDLQRLYRGTY